MFRKHFEYTIYIKKEKLFQSVIISIIILFLYQKKFFLVIKNPYFFKKKYSLNRKYEKNFMIKIFRFYTCLSLSAVALPESKSTVVFEVRSGFSRILSMINSMTSIIASTVPVMRHTLSVVPVTDEQNGNQRNGNKDSENAQNVRIAMHTRIKIMRFRHLHPCPCILLKLSNCISTFPDNGPGCNSGDQYFEVIRSISTCKIRINLFLNHILYI